MASPLATTRPLGAMQEARGGLRRGSQWEEPTPFPSRHPGAPLGRRGSGVLPSDPFRGGRWARRTTPPRGRGRCPHVSTLAPEPGHVLWMLDQLSLFRWHQDMTGFQIFPRDSAAGRARAHLGQCLGSWGRTKPGSVWRAHHTAHSSAGDTDAHLTPSSHRRLPFFLKLHNDLEL